MYAEHVPIIREYAWSSPEAMADVLIFVRATVRRRTYAVPAVIDKVRERGATGFPSRQDWKAYKGIQLAAPALYNYYRNPWEAMYLMVRIYGFGLAKAGFVTQMVYGKFGCLDVHNLRRLGRNKPFPSVTHTPLAKVTRMLREYTKLCDSLGGTERLWDDWCTNVHFLYPTHFDSPDHVSKWHVDCIVR